jgi:hypothetical protein
MHHEPTQTTNETSHTNKGMPEPILAPWNNLKGWGYISVYKPDPEWVLDCANLSAWDKDHYVGGPAITMLVRYASAECGPYDELLCMMGRFRTNRGVYPKLHRIWVSSQESIVSGRYNWANPKELAHFDMHETEQGLEALVTSDLGKVTLQYHTGRFSLKFPITTALATKNMRLIVNKTLAEQNRTEPLCYSEPKANGWCKPAKLHQFNAERGMLPDLSSQKNLLNLHAYSFNLAFPEAEFGF